MKTLNKIYLIDSILEENELRELKGGVKNKNTILDCQCTYYDGNRVSNTNKAEGCSCDCRY